MVPPTSQIYVQRPTPPIDSAGGYYHGKFSARLVGGHQNCRHVGSVAIFSDFP